MKIELYINGTLADVSAGFTIRLNRKFIDTSVLYAKDAQFSYGITLPKTSTNNTIFGFIGVEEVVGKFDRLYKANLNIDGIQVFNGEFWLRSISAKGYEGNMVVRAPKSVKDIFGDMKLSDVAPLLLPFGDFATSVSQYNRNPDLAIFPLVAYGVLPKTPQADNTYSAKDVWDNTNFLRMADLSPSVNVMKLVRHIFESKGYTIGGNAFQDNALLQLYQSYQNDKSIPLAWNWGRQARINIQGTWFSWNGVSAFEKGVYQNGTNYACDIFDSTNVAITSIDDVGRNVLQSQRADSNGNIFKQIQVRIPTSGFYKVRLTADVNLRGDNLRRKDGQTQITHISARSQEHNTTISSGRFSRMFEFRLLRDWGRGDFGLASAKLDGSFYYDNQPQTTRKIGETGFDENIDLPKYFPNFDSMSSERQINLIDMAHDPNIVCGFGWGEPQGTKDYRNPLDTSSELLQIEVAKPSMSWDPKASSEIPRLALANDPYQIYDLVEEAGNNNIAGYVESNRYKIEMGFRTQPTNYIQRTSNTEGNGTVNCICWFNAGELLTLASVCTQGYWRKSYNTGINGYIYHSVDFGLQLTPFQTKPEWLKVDLAGNGTSVMNYNDPSDFDFDSIDLAKFLPQGIRVDEYIDNLCKMFNLVFSQVSEKEFRIDKLQKMSGVTGDLVNLDAWQSIDSRINTPLGIPKEYKLGFTVNTDEQGYAESNYDGSGIYPTKTIDSTAILEQKSSFSYNWMKRFTYSGGSFEIPIISKKDDWLQTTAYSDAMKNRYTDLGLRFWYYDGLLPDIFSFNNNPVAVAKVSNELRGILKLDYSKEPQSILSNYFNIYDNATGHFTEFDCYLSAPLWYQLVMSRRAIYNGDVYKVAEISGFDPTLQNMTHIKLMKNYVR